MVHHITSDQESIVMAVKHVKRAAQNHAQSIFVPAISEEHEKWTVKLHES